MGSLFLSKAMESKNKGSTQNKKLFRIIEQYNLKTWKLLRNYRTFTNSLKSIMTNLFFKWKGSIILYSISIGNTKEYTAVHIMINWEATKNGGVMVEGVLKGKMWGREKNTQRASEK